LRSARPIDGCRSRARSSGRPNEQIAFGKGEHFCAGAHLARLELRLLLADLLARIEHFELSDKVERLKSNLIAGIKHMSVRFTRSHVAT
jgi:cytochrome P450